jgi:hypothetical protein
LKPDQQAGSCDIVRAVLWQRVDGAIIFAVGLILFWRWNDSLPWWGAVLIFFAPDLSFAAYLLGPRRTESARGIWFHNGANERFTCQPFRRMRLR